MTSTSNLKVLRFARVLVFPRNALLVDVCAQRAAQRLVQYVFLHVIQPTQTIHFLRSLATSLGFSCWFRLFQCHVFVCFFFCCCCNRAVVKNHHRLEHSQTSTANPTEFGTAMAYRVNGLPPFQVSFSITFPEGYVGKEKMDTKFHVDADDSQVQACPVVGRVVGVSHQFVKCCRWRIGEKHPDAG